MFSSENKQIHQIYQPTPSGLRKVDYSNQLVTQGISHKLLLGQFKEHNGLQMLHGERRGGVYKMTLYVGGGGGVNSPD